MSIVRVAAIQHDIAWVDRQANYAALAPRISVAAAGGARIVLLTETFATGFAFSDPAIAEPEGEVWINSTGDSGLATGGSGDVLTGAVSAFLAQGLDPIRAAQAGCWLHGRAGEIGGEQYPAAVPAAELPAFLARAWQEFEPQ